MLELAFVLFLLTIRISDCLCLAHITSRNQDEFTVSFILRRKFIFLFFEEAVRIWSFCEFCWYRLDCSYGVLAVFYNNIFISGSKLLSPLMKAVIRTCACAISLDHLDFRLFMFGSHSYSKSELTVSFISRRKFIFLFSEEAVRIRSLCNFTLSFVLQSWCTGCIL